MKGSYQVRVGNKRVSYRFVVRRNITILRGDSATGKTTLIDMVAQYESEGAASGVMLSCDRPCTVLGGTRWESQLKAIKGSIVFIDEGDSFVASKEFAKAIQKTDNYYVIATRASLYELPYSVEEIYGIRNVTRQRYEQVRRLYSALYPLHDDARAIESPEVVIVEDSNAGYRFFKALCDRSGIRCVAAGGRDNVRKAILDCGDERILVIADGAAFGPEVEDVLALQQVRDVGFFFPESFEWLILKSGLVKDSDIPEILANPEDYIESRKYVSWERFFTRLLMDRTKGTCLQYNKRRLNKNYLNEREMGRVAAQVPVMRYE